MAAATTATTPTPAPSARATSPRSTQASYQLGPVRLFGFVRNLFDGFQVTQVYFPGFGTVNEPRRYGPGVEARF